VACIAARTWSQTLRKVCKFTLTEPVAAELLRELRYEVGAGISLNVGSEIRTTSQAYAQCAHSWRASLERTTAGLRCAHSRGAGTGLTSDGVYRWCHGHACLCCPQPDSPATTNIRITTRGLLSRCRCNMLSFGWCKYQTISNTNCQ
jgi:hypothetical protein